MTCDFSLVIPVYNEGPNIRALCAALKRDLPGQQEGDSAGGSAGGNAGGNQPVGEILICYDFDGDSTLPALAAMADDEKPKGLRLVKNDLGKGVRYAIEAGMRAAKGDVVVVTMADLSDDISQVSQMVRLIREGHGVVAGSRYMKGGKQLGGPWLKSMMSYVAGVSLYWVAGVPTHDPTNSFKAYRRSYLEKVKIEASAGFVLGMELTLKAHFGGEKVTEIPTTWRDRAAGESRFNLRKWVPLYLYWYVWAMGCAYGLVKKPKL